MNAITVLGASGFIGSHLVTKLKAMGADCFAPGRNDDLPGRELGHVIYCVGLTADFRTRPFDTVEAHVCNLKEILQRCRYDSFLYLSSTRLYALGGTTASEEDLVQVNPADGSDLYNISKLMGESLTLSCGGERARVARLSNVYGDDFNSDNFLSAVIREAVTKGRVSLTTTLDSAKDYVNVDDVASALVRIATEGRERIYNLASGMNVANRDLVREISRTTNCRVEVAGDARTVIFPRISIERVRDEFGFKPSQVLDDLERLVKLYESCV